MPLILTDQQRTALDAAPEDVPARATDVTTGETLVLLKTADFDWVRDLLGDEPDAPRATDPRTDEVFALVPEVRYERFKPFFEEDPPSAEERRWQLREFGLRGGWDDPAMDVYDEKYGEKP